jgi:hypothetical protein
MATAARALEPPTIDGALDEEVWREAVALTDFVQAEPLEGQPASQQTEVRLAYDDTALFIGVRLHDNDPSQIVVSDSPAMRGSAIWIRFRSSSRRSGIVRTASSSGPIRPVLNTMPRSAARATRTPVGMRAGT